MLIALAMVAGLVGLVTGPAGAAHPGNTVFVDGANCPGPGDGSPGDPFCTIQSGVDHASDGDTVKVASGTYVEQVEVNKSITLQGHGDPTIVAPASPTTYVFPESGASWDPVVFLVGGTVAGGTVTGSGTIAADIRGFIVDGDDRNPADRSAGILLRNVLPGSVKDNVVRNMHLGGRQTVGIIVYGDSDVMISGNDVSEYSRAGIVGSGDAGALPDPTTKITNNTATGPGTTDPGDSAPNGIQIGFGAIGSVVSNTVADHGFSGGDVGSGIIIFGAGGPVDVTTNRLSGNEVSISVSEDTFFSSGDSDGSKVTGNKISDGVEDGDGIQIAGSDDVHVSGNEVNDAGDDGIQVGNGSTGAHIAGNRVNDSGDDGIVATSSTSGNTFRGNKVSGSGDLACNDTGTGNSWRGNKGEKPSSPAGIC